MGTGFVHDERFLLHDPGEGHPESPDRLRAVMAHLNELPWFGGLVRVPARPADPDRVLSVHSAEYVDRARAACEDGARTLDVPDVGICPASYDTALLAAGGAIALADAVASGKVRNGFALLRPPGHHALRGSAMGFCLFNNIAIAARFLQDKHRLGRIAIVDWDVHHGNGTQDTFYEDPSVLYVSLHQYPFYPGTGAASETGAGAGKGATLNLPMPQESNDFDYQEMFTDKVLPKLEEFKPEAVLISAGFDAHAKDPLANIRLTSDCFSWMTLRLMEVAEKYSGGRIVSLLEGGYDLQALPLCIEKHLAALSGNHDVSFKALG
jgi:acetoin utilization deacetylase AcuC-like enzyme